MTEHGEAPRANGRTPLHRLRPDRAQTLLSLWWCRAVFVAIFRTSDSLGLSFLLALPLAGWAVMLILYGFWRGWRLRSTPDRWYATAAIFPAALLLSPWIIRAANHAAFLLDRPRYEEIVSGVEQGAMPSSSQTLTYRGTEYLVEPGRPVRIAFSTGGLIDNWSAVVYDPSHRVALAHGFTPDGASARRRM